MGLPREPVLRFPAETLLRAQGIRLLFLDVDGVMTDGSIYYQACGMLAPAAAAESIKQFNTLDGYGLKLLQRAGVALVVITGRDSLPLRARLSDLGLANAHFGVENKLEVAEHVLRELGLGWRQAAAMGDDWPDLGVMRACGFCGAPANAHPEVKAVAHHVTTARGGEGAVREMADLLLVAGGHYVGLLDGAGA